jgi:copper oxidase (laccase) domain-containing protein
VGSIVPTQSNSFLSRCHGSSAGVFAPWLDFAHDVVYANEMEEVSQGLLRGPRPADGCLVRCAGDAVFIANGDCCVGALWHARGHALVVMHLGLDCLWRDDDKPTLMERAVEELDCSHTELAFWVGFGIGPCCHGYRHDGDAHQKRADALRARYGDSVFPGAVRWGPRRGQAAYDHMGMATSQARALGVTKLDSSPKCTACAGLDDPNLLGYGTHFSNTRDHTGGRERNCVLVTLDGE